MSRETPAASLNHIGIAVSDVPALKKLFEFLGLGVDHVENVPEQGVKAHFLPLPLKPGHLEFLEVTDPQGTVAKYLAKRGPGIHHLAFQVASGTLDGLCAQLKGAGYRLTYEKPQPGAHGMRVNFVHPASAGGMLVELVEH